MGGEDVWEVMRMKWLTVLFIVIYFRHYALCNHFVNETYAAHKRVERDWLNGEEACENHGYDKQQCLAIGCCQFSSPSDPLPNQCHSAVDRERCHDFRCHGIDEDCCTEETPCEEGD